MASEPSSDESSRTGSPVQLSTVDLHVLSPSPELKDGRLTLAGISLDTKVSELKALIQNLTETHPLPSRQRLIYRGRPLLREQDSLRDILRLETQEPDASRSCTLHLVLTPNDSSGNPFHPPVTTASPSSNPLTPGNPPSLPHRVAGPGTSQGNGPIPGVRTQTAQPPNPLPHAHIAQALIQNQLAALQQQLQQQLGPNVHLSGFNLPQNLPNTAIPAPAAQGNVQQQQSPSRTTQVPQLSPEQRHQLLMQTLANRQPHQQHQQHAATANPRVAVPNVSSNPTLGPSHPPSGGSAPSNLPQGPSITSFTHDTIGPNGTRMRVTVNQSVTVNHSTQRVPGSAQPAGSVGLLDHNSSPHPVANGEAVEALAGGGSQTSSGAPAALSSDQSEQSSTRLFENIASSRQPPFVSGSLAPASNIISAASSMSGHPPQAEHPQNGSTATEQPTVYLLSSPSGPHAILISPQGTYTAGSQFVPHSAVLVHRQQPNFSWRHHTPTSNVASPQGSAATAATQDTEVARPPELNAAQNEGPAQAQDAARNADRDFALSIIRRFWLFLRLYIFAFLFSEAGTWRRWILLGLGALVAVLSETEFIRQVRRLTWEPFMRHIEGLVPLAPNVPRNLNQVEDQRQIGAALQPGRGQRDMPDPDEVAQRLLRERNERNVDSFRQFLRWVERAVALFVASLVPGVGERHIQARNEEVARITAQREAQEAREREEAEQQRGESSSHEDGINQRAQRIDETTGTETGTTTNGQASQQNEPQQQQQQQQQPPLIEV